MGSRFHLSFVNVNKRLTPPIKIFPYKGLDISVKAAIMKYQ